MVKVSYPKFKNGEATVKSVRIKPNFGMWQVLCDIKKLTKIYSCLFYIEITKGYVEEVFNVIMEASKEDTKTARDELKKKTPPPMHEMLDKQSKKEAIAKREERKKMVTQNVPPTAPGKQNCMSVNVTQCAPNFTNAKILNFLRAELIIKSMG